MKKLDKVVVVGVGLIGGSFALALREAGAVNRIVGLGRSQANLDRAVDMGVIDEASTDVSQALAGADLVMLAMPVGQTARVMAMIEPHLGDATVITDAGSTKQDVLAVAYTYLQRQLSRFVPAHPIAGAEQSGVEAANVHLYEGRNVVITPLPQTDDEAVRLVTDVWTACGARVSTMTPEEHDDILATISHLPHVLAYTLMHEVATSPRAADLMRYAGSGFRDFTRIAGSSPEMWRDICLANRESLLAQMDSYLEQLGLVRIMLGNGDGRALEQMFGEARAARARMLEGK